MPEDQKINRKTRMNVQVDTEDKLALLANQRELCNKSN